MVSTGDSKSLGLGSNPSGSTMETTFKYKGKIISTPNLEKKLKRMKISIYDIEIVNDKKIIIENDEDEEESELQQVIVRSTEDTIKRICYIPKGKHIPIRELFKNQIWNPETKTGIEELTEEFLMTMYYES